MMRPLHAVLMLFVIGAVDVWAGPSKPKTPRKKTTFGDLIRIAPAGKATREAAVWRHVALGVAQITPFSAVTELGGSGPVAAINERGVLNTVFLGFPTSFNVKDVAVTNRALIAVGSLQGQPGAVVLRAAAEGRFLAPQKLKLHSQPNAVAVGDFDADGTDDIAIAEASSIEVFTWSFLNTGAVTPFDRSNLAVVRLGGNPTSPTDPFVLSNGPLTGISPVVSLTTSFFDNDANADLAFVSTTGPNQFVYVRMTTPTGFSAATIAGSGSAVTVTARTDMIASGALNVCPPAGVPDNIADIVVAGANRLDFIRTVPNVDPNLDPTFTFGTIATAGTQPNGVVIADVNGDTRNDVVVSNYGSGTINTNLAAGAPNFGYLPPSASLSVGPQTVGIKRFNYNNTAGPHFIVGTGEGGSGLVWVFQTNGVTSSLVRNAILQGATSLSGGVLDSSSQGDDVVIGTTAGPAFLGNQPTQFTPRFIRGFTTSTSAATLDGLSTFNDLVAVQQTERFFTAQNVTITATTNDLVSLVNLDGFPGATANRIDLTSLLQFPSPEAVTGISTLGGGTAGLALSTFSLSGAAQFISALNDGTGSFADPSRYLAQPVTATAMPLITGDVNLDSLEDVIVANLESDSIQVALNQGGGNFALQGEIATGGAVPVGARLADVNDDDFVDLVVVNQGILQPGSDQSLLTVLHGNGSGQFTLAGQPVQVSNFALSLAGGNPDAGTGLTKPIDFNSDGYPDFAVASTRGAAVGPLTDVPAIDILINDPLMPGRFVRQNSLSVAVTATANPDFVVHLESAADGPGIVSGFGGDPSLPGIGIGGANRVLNIADYNADGSPDLYVAGTIHKALDLDNDGIGDAGRTSAGIPGVPNTTQFPGTGFALGNQATASFSEFNIQTYPRVLSSLSPFFEGMDTFVSSASGNFAQRPNGLPDLAHLTFNGNLWVDVNDIVITNHAPDVTIARPGLNAPLGMGRKHTITSGQVGQSIPVQIVDADNDLVTVQLSRFDGQAPPANMRWDAANSEIDFDATAVNTGTLPLQMRIVVQATDDGPLNLTTSVGTNGITGGLRGRDYFTLIILPGGAPAPAPTISSVIPPSATAGSQVQINGTGFVNGATVTFAGTPATSVTFVNSTTLFAVVPNVPAGPVTVVVTNPDAQSAPFVGFSVAAAGPAISDVQPRSAAPGTQVTLTGTGFVNGATVTFGGTPATSVTFVSAQTLQAVVPVRAGGPAPVTVINPDGQSATFNNFSVLEGALTILDVQPRQATPGQQLTITGTGFLTGVTVMFGSTAAPGVTIVSATEMRVTVPSLPEGPVTITITTPGGQTSSFAAFGIALVAIPTLSSVLLLLMIASLTLTGALVLRR